MKIFTLKRFSDNKNGYFGVLFDGDMFMCCTLERPWLDNKNDISCIPAGKYTVKRGHFPEHGESFEVTGVPNRSTILLHKGNYYTDSKGCILLGAGFSVINKQLAISNSGEAYNRFMEYMKGENEFELTILNV